jgi:hypothetical protein
MREGCIGKQDSRIGKREEAICEQITAIRKPPPAAAGGRYKVTERPD